MAENQPSEFLTQLENVIRDRMSDEGFGVSELSKEVGMSRSNLLRKVKNETKLSASVYIRQIRLKEGMKLLQQTSLNVSEVSYKVGFSSVSYFIKCFREYFGYPPGEVGKRAVDQQVEPKKPTFRSLFLIILAIVVLSCGYWFMRNSTRKETSEVLPKSIAVLPFRNESSNSSNVYLINGVMESILNNLQRIEDLRVISRTSVERFRNGQKSIPEIAKELNVSYIVEGSGQKVGDKILLNIQLIEASSDRRIWGEQYNRQVQDIFELQLDVAKLITSNIEIVLKPMEVAQIEKKLTENNEAYDYYLRAQELMYQGNTEGFLGASGWLEKAISLDSQFAAAYADLAVCYFYLDIFKEEKTHDDQIREASDKAMLYDDEIPQSLIAKAFYHMSLNEHNIAAPYLEKAHELQPNSPQIINLLSDYYARYNPNTVKYLEYALKGIQIDLSPDDSINASFSYLHLSNALIQTGFVDLALKYIDRSISFAPENGYSKYVKAYMLFAKNGDLEETRNLLIKEYEKDTSRLDILVEVGKVLYFERNYEEAYRYFESLNDQRELMNLDIFSYENIKVAYVYGKMGFKEESKKYLESFRQFAENDPSIYKPLSMAAYFAYTGQKEKALDEMEKFTNVQSFQYWLVLFYDLEPLYEDYLTDPRFQKISEQIEKNFWTEHERIEEVLKEKNLL